jgi:pyruvate/2-oxoglutarate dehydrogenase complex dihydrolipoamide dehydrogenase (E3) component/uncharacterized membrane protein YdjX (TVP38/TMEM64 family)
VLYYNRDSHWLGLAGIFTSQLTSITMNLKKLSLLLLLGTFFVAFFWFDGSRYLRFDTLKSSHATLNQWYADQPLAFIASYFVVYVLATALSFPGAVVLTLAGGAIFGLGWGTLIVSFASSIGATLAFLVARFLLRDRLEARFGARLAEFNRGVASEGAFYLFTLRLVPLVPFFVINLLMGLTQMSTRTYYIVSQLGMLAGTAVYVNAGTQLAQLDAVQGILSPPLLGSLLLLGLFPWLARHVAQGLKQRQIYARWRHLKPKQFDRNLVVIGAGAGGLVTAYIAAAVKARVTLVEAHKMGGDCLNYGCVRSKALIKSAQMAHDQAHGARYGLSNTAPVFSFKAVMQRVNEVIAAVAPHDSVARYTALGVEVLQGHARIVNPWTVEISQPRPDGQAPEVQRLTTRAIVIAAGARPSVPPLPGLHAVGYLTSDTLWDAFAPLDALPQRLLILGGGPIGCELAQSFARLGAAVTLVEMAPRLLMGEDADAGALVAQSLLGDGVRLLTAHRALRCEPLPGAAPLGHNTFGPGCLVLDHAGTAVNVAFDALLCAVGRSARLTGYGLEELGIATEKTVLTNAYLQTIYPNIYAAGDVAGPMQLTHVAAHQAWYAAVNALFGGFKKFKVDNRVIPRATFTDPELARVGLNEQEARANNTAFEVTKFELADLDRALTDGQTTGFVKVLTVPGKDRILGVTIVGQHAGDLLAEYVLAMKHGLGLSQILGTIHTYPTLSEANKYAAGAWKRAHAPERLLQWVAKYHNWKRG